MPITHINVTAIAHSDQRMEDQLLSENTLPASAEGYHTFLYDWAIEFILIKTNSEVSFRRIMPLSTEAASTSTRWDDRSGGEEEEQYYIFKVDPAQKVMVAGSPTVRFFRCPDDDGDEEKEASASEEDPQSTTTPSCTAEGGSVRPWEAEDVYQQRDKEDGEGSFPPEHLAEVARRFKAWRALTTESLFVYLMVPKKLSEAEWVQLLENGIQFFDDVPWVL